MTYFLLFFENSILPFLVLPRSCAGVGLLFCGRMAHTAWFLYVYYGVFFCFDVQMLTSNDSDYCTSNLFDALISINVLKYIVKVI